MKVYNDYASKNIDKPAFIEVLRLVQSFVWRRFILGLPTSVLNKIFMTLYDKIDPENYLPSIQKILTSKSGTQKFPQDQEVLDSLKSKDIYSFQPKNKFYFFEKLENYNNNEIVVINGNNDITIEHIFPQKPDSSWRNDLKLSDLAFLEENLHTMANLTLSGNNGPLSNKSFPEKKEMNKDNGEQGYIYSRLWLNRYLKEIERWDREAWEERYKILSDRFLEIWSRPQIKTEDENPNVETNIFDADDPTSKKLEYAIFMGERLEINNVTSLYVEVFRMLFTLQPETFFNHSELRGKINICKEPDRLIAPEPISDTYFIEKNIGSNVYKFDRIEQALTIFNLEDELIIKYADN